MTNVHEALNVVEQALLNAIAVMENKTELTTTQRESRKAAAITQCKNALMELECKAALADIEKCEPVFTNTNHGFVMTDRNFTYAGNGYIQDNNFDHDAALKITGDFATGDLDKYAQMITNHLNTSPISKEWVGLSDIQKAECASHTSKLGILGAVNATESMCKQLNAEKGWL